MILSLGAGLMLGLLQDSIVTGLGIGEYRPTNGDRGAGDRLARVLVRDRTRIGKGRSLRRLFRRDRLRPIRGEAFGLEPCGRDGSHRLDEFAPPHEITSSRRMPAGR